MKITCIIEMEDINSLDEFKVELQTMVDDYTDMNEGAKDIIIYGIEEIED